MSVVEEHDAVVEALGALAAAYGWGVHVAENGRALNPNTGNDGFTVGFTREGRTAAMIINRSFYESLKRFALSMKAMQ